MLVEQFDETVEQSVRHPLVMNVSLHPHVARRAWWCRPREVADPCIALPRGVVPGS